MMTTIPSVTKRQGLDSRHLFIFAAIVLSLGNIISWSTCLRSSFTRQPADTSIFQYALTSSSDRNVKRICSQNPYLDALAEPVESIVRDKVDHWLYGAGRQEHGTMAYDPSNDNWDHKRFYPFEPMTKCGEEQCLGGPCRSDASKIACGLQQLQNRSSCVVYSIGGNNKWSFENDLLARTLCEVHTFDCTGDRSRFHVPNHTRLTFHYICLSAYPKQPKEEEEDAVVGRSMGNSWTLLEMQQKLGHSRIDLLKMDIEGFEHDLLHSWPKLELVEASQNILLPMQILVEVGLFVSFFEGYGSRLELSLLTFLLCSFPPLSLLTDMISSSFCLSSLYIVDTLQDPIQRASPG